MTEGPKDRGRDRSTHRDRSSEGEDAGGRRSALGVRQCQCPHCPSSPFSSPTSSLGRTPVLGRPLPPSGTLTEHLLRAQHLSLGTSHRPRAVQPTSGAPACALAMHLYFPCALTPPAQHSLGPITAPISQMRKWRQHRKSWPEATWLRGCKATSGRQSRLQAIPGSLLWGVWCERPPCLLGAAAHEGPGVSEPLGGPWRACMTRASLSGHVPVGQLQLT